MSKIDNIISIIMVFVTAFSFATASSSSAAMTLLIVVVSFILYEVIVSVANSNPSIRTVLFVTIGFVFGLSLTMVFKLEKGWLAALICLLCMGYKYFCAQANEGKRSKSKNIFVIFVNAFFYSIMFTILECIIFANSSTLFILMYLVSFAFFMCAYIAYKSNEKPKPVNGSKAQTKAKRDVGNDWRHILNRSGNYYREIRVNAGKSLGNISDRINRAKSNIRNFIMPSKDSSYSHDEYKALRDKLTFYKQQIDTILEREDLNDNEYDMLLDIKDEFDIVYNDFYKDQKFSQLECEARLCELANHIEMLKNSIKVRKARDIEDAEREAQRSQRSRAQQERRRREREARRAKEQEEQEKAAREEADRKEREQREQREEEERQRQDEEKRRQDKRRRERNTKNSSSDKKDDKSGFTTGDDTKYFKGCTTVDDLSLRYKKLCLIYHPDSANGDADTYIELKEEYERLKKRFSI